MNIPSNAPRHDRSIAGVAITFPEIYAAGHVLTEGEASQLNQVAFENVSNNLREKVKLGVVTGEGEAQSATPHTTESLQPIVDKFLSEYEMGVRRAGSGEPRVTDPVEKEARKIARDNATALIKSKGGKPADYDVADIAGKIFDANKDALMAAGKKIVRDREAALSKAGELVLGDIDLTAKAAAEPAAA